MSTKPINQKRNVLGRGLASLIQEAESDTIMVNNDTGDKNKSLVSEIEISKIIVNSFQPRTHFDEISLLELSDSIKLHGIIQPITVRRLAEDSYQVISGERRLRATQIAGLTAIPAYIRTANDQQMLELGIIENIQRENLNSLEIALSYQRLIFEFELKQEDLGERVGKNRATVANYMRLLKLPPDIQAAIRDEKLTFGHARALISIENIGDQLAIFKKVLRDQLSVRQTEILVSGLKAQKKERKEVAEISADDWELKNIEKKLSSHFATKISLKVDKDNKGNISIPFYSTEDLNRVLEVLALI